jgi:hypothetical protein
MTVPQDNTTVSLADTLKSNMVVHTLIINGGNLNQELFENLVKRMNSVQRKTALMIIKRYNLGVKKGDQEVQTDKEEDILRKEFELER